MALGDGTSFGGTVNVAQTPPPAALQARADDVPFWDPGAPVESFASPSAWDVLVIGNETLPGVAIVTGGRRQKLDRKDSPGTDSSTITQLGREPAQIEVRLVMWTPEQLAQWVRIAKVLHPPFGKGMGKPYDVYHPGLAALSIWSLILVDIGVTAPGGQPGVYESRLRFIEFAPPAQVGTKTPLSSGHDTKVGQGKPQKIPQTMPSAEP